MKKKITINKKELEDIDLTRVKDIERLDIFEDRIEITFELE